MFRKSIIAVVTASAMAAAALAPTSAFAHHGHWHHHYGWVGPAFVAGAILGTAAIAAERDSCYVHRWVDTPYGPRRVLVDVC